MWCHCQKWSGSHGRPSPSTPRAPLAATISPPGNARPWLVDPPSFPISCSKFIPMKDKGRLSSGFCEKHSGKSFNVNGGLAAGGEKEEWD